jgi:hypothetical protein
MGAFGMKSKWNHRRFFAALFDALCAAILAALISLLLRLPLLANLVSLACFLLRDTFTPKGSPGKLLAHLELEGAGNDFVSRARASVLRNLQFELTNAAALVMQAIAFDHTLLLLPVGLLVYLVECLKIRSTGSRFGDRFAGTTVKDCAPGESPGKMILLCCACFVTLFLCAIVQTKLLPSVVK